MLHFVFDSRPSIRIFRAVVALSLLGAILVLATPAGYARAEASTSGLSGAPSDGTTNDDRSRFSYQVDPGQHLDDFYLLRNTGTTAQTMKVFATDAFNTPSGEFSLLDTQAAPTDVGTWVTFSGGQHSIEVPLAAGESRVISFRLSVPADATPGDHAGGVVISVAAGQGNIVVDRRVATRLYVRVKGALQASLTVSNIAAAYVPSLNPFSGTTTVRFTLRNNGNVALGANAVVDVKSYFGVSVSSLIRSTVLEMLPRTTRVVSVDVPGVPQIGYLAPHVNLVPTVAADALNPGQLRTTDRVTNLFVMPWWLLIILLGGLTVWVIARLRRRANSRAAENWILYVEAEARRSAVSEEAEIDSVQETVGAVGGAVRGERVD